MAISINQSHETTRRDFIKSTAIGTTAAAAILSGLVSPLSAEGTVSPVVMMPLPYPENALEPSISAKTLNLHYGVHYRKYIDDTIARSKATEWANASLEKIIKETYGGINMIESLHQMALMAWNHEFYWKSMKPNGGGELPEKLKAPIVESFGSVDAFKSKFKDAAMTFGSGWTWLVLDKGKLNVTYTTYHDTPLLKDQKPLLTLDCWEHAYYLDYDARRGEYIDAYLNKLVNWDFALSNMPALAGPAATTAKKKK